jgi:hypothetical protein
LKKIWNVFFLKGWKIILRIGLALIWQFKDEICSKSLDEIPDFLKNFVRDNIEKLDEVD